jgi:hypothetical protein
MATAKPPLGSAVFQFSARGGPFYHRWFGEKGTVDVVAR